MKTVILSFAIGGLFALNVGQAANVNWTISPGVLDTEVSTNGTQVFGYYFNPVTTRPPVVVVNTVPFTSQPTAIAPPGLNFNGSYNNPEDVSLYEVPLSAGNSGLNQILDGQNWGNEAPLTMTGLTPGQPYELQFMISDDRPAYLNLRNYDVSDSNDPEGSRDIERAYHSTRGGGIPAGAPIGSLEAKIFTGSFTADATGTQDIRNWLYSDGDHTGTNAGSQVNAIQLRQIVPEPASIALALIGFGLFALGLRRAHMADVK